MNKVIFGVHMKSLLSLLALVTVAAQAQAEWTFSGAINSGFAEIKAGLDALVSKKTESDQCQIRISFDSFTIMLSTQDQQTKDIGLQILKDATKTLTDADQYYQKSWKSLDEANRLVWSAKFKIDFMDDAIGAMDDLAAAVLWFQDAEFHYNDYSDEIQSAVVQTNTFEAYWKIVTGK